MLQLLDLTQKNVIATRANDLLEKNDCEKIRPLVHNIICAGKKVRWYFEMVEDATPGLTEFLENGVTGAHCGDINFMHTGDMEKIAMVGTEKWIKYMYSVMKSFTKASIMYFDLPDKQKAIDWILNGEE